MLTNEERISIKNFFESKGLPLDRAVTFSDVALPESFSNIRSRSEIQDFKTRLARGLELEIPILSANMESVTGLDLAIALEKEGGLAFPPQSLPIKDRSDLIHRIGRADSALIDEPVVALPNSTIEDAKALMAEFNIRSLVVVDKKKETDRHSFYERLAL